MVLAKVQHLKFPYALQPFGALVKNEYAIHVFGCSAAFNFG
jgi:hypothetical protein